MSTLRPTATTGSRSAFLSEPSSSSGSVLATSTAPPGRSAGLLVNERDRPELHPALVEELREQVRCTLAAADAARAPITCLGAGLVPERPRLHPGRSSDWVVTPLSDDPLHRNGRFPIPARQRRHLTRLHRAHVHMDDLVVAHEIPKALAPSVLPMPVGSAPVELDRDDLPALITHPGPAPSTVEFATRAGNIAGTVGRLAGVAGKGVAAATAAATTRVALGRLDPVVFGIQRIPGHPHAGLIYELVRWEW